MASNAPRPDITRKKLENARKTLDNFIKKRKSLAQRVSSGNVTIDKIKAQVAKKRKRTEEIRGKNNTKQSTIQNNERYCRRREESIAKKQRIVAEFDKREKILADKIAKKKVVVRKLEQKLDRQS